MPRAPLALLVLSLLASAASAQTRISRDGLWGSFAFGAGSAGVSCGFCTDEREWAPAGSVAFGGTLSNQVLIGGGASGYGRLSETSDTYLGWVYGLVRAYPSRGLGGFVNGGIGVNYGRGTTSTDDYSALGLGFVAGVGWDFALSQAMAVTAAANAHFSVGGYLEQNGVQASSSSFSPSMFSVALGLTLF